MNISFKRITSSGRFIPEIDGLRFVAIATVVLQHLHGFLSIKKPDIGQHIAWLDFFYSYSPLGVPLFFIVSGFVLALPFARHHLQGAAPPLLKDYYLRRLTRLEPPYIIAMTLLLLGIVFVAHTLPLAAVVKSYVASLFYLHNIFYPGQLPAVNPAAWSLEVEVQFYLLAPFLAALFAIKRPLWRRCSIACLALLFVFLNQCVLQLPFISLYNWLAYFLTGFLLADFYLTKEQNLTGNRWDGLLALLVAAAVGPLLASGAGFYAELLVLACLFVFFYLIVLRKAWALLSLPVITGIGGMCYSIYLLHYAIISAVGNPLLRWQLPFPAWAATIIYFALLLAAVLLCSVLFFLLIERPCMRKNWYRFSFPKNRRLAAGK